MTSHRAIEVACDDIEDRLNEVRDYIDVEDYESALDSAITMKDEVDTLITFLRKRVASDV